jgi:hypothetical protein
MTPEKSDRYRKISMRAGVIASCFILLFLASLANIAIYENTNPPPRWTGILTGTAMLGSLISSVICLAAAILGRKKSS